MGPPRAEEVKHILGIDIFAWRPWRYKLFQTSILTFFITQNVGYLICKHVEFGHICWARTLQGDSGVDVLHNQPPPLLY